MFCATQGKLLAGFLFLATIASVPTACFPFIYRRSSLDKAGANMEVAKFTEKLVPSTRFVSVDGVAPLVAEHGTFVAPSASVIGDVTIGRNSR